MFIKVLGSGSSGNGYIIGNEQEQIIIECGMPFRDVEKAMNGNVSNIKGVLVSHSHGDHMKFASQYALRLPLFATKGTFEEAQSSKMDNFMDYESYPACQPIKYKKTFALGDFKVMPFKTYHDTKEPCGFIIKLPNGSNLVFATDTYKLPYRFSNISYWMIECNYDRTLLKQNVTEGIVHLKVAERVIASHLNIDSCIRTLQENDLTRTREIILIHLSNNNSQKDFFVDEVGRATGKFVTVATHEKNIELL